MNRTDGFFVLINMRQKIRLALILFVVVLVFSACSNIELERTVKIQIPKHPWEDSGESLWYSLKWTSGSEINALYVPKDARELSLTIPAGESVFVCAFPLGNMRPFGTVITPFDEAKVFVLEQNDGILAQLFMDSDRAAVAGINYPRVKAKALEVSFDFRLLDQVRLLKDALNGKLTENSFKAVEAFDVPSFDIPTGFWVSEAVLGHNILTTSGATGNLKLPSGVHRYYNSSMKRELVIVVDTEGKVFHYVRVALV